MMRKKEEGFTILGLVVSATMIVVVVLAIASLAIQTSRVGHNSRDRFIATQLAKEGIELMRSLRDDNYLSTPIGATTILWRGRVIDGGAAKKVKANNYDPIIYDEERTLICDSVGQNSELINIMNTILDGLAPGSEHFINVDYNIEPAAFEKTNGSWDPWQYVGLFFTLNNGKFTFEQTGRLVMNKTLFSATSPQNQYPYTHRSDPSNTVSPSSFRRYIVVQTIDPITHEVIEQDSLCEQGVRKNVGPVYCSYESPSTPSYCTMPGSVTQQLCDRNDPETWCPVSNTLKAPNPLLITSNVCWTPKNALQEQCITEKQELYDWMTQR